MEKRKRDRYFIDVPVKLLLSAEDSEQETLTVHTKNISSEGVLLSTDTVLSQGSKVKMEMVLPVNKLLEMIGEQKKVLVRVNGKVIRTGDEGMAVKFDRDYQITAMELE